MRIKRDPGAEWMAGAAARTGMLGILVLATLAAIANSAEAVAVIDRASSETYDRIVELHFGIRGRGLKWHLTSRGQELQIDLARTRLEIAPRPLDGDEPPPVKFVRAVNYGAAHAQIIIEVSGKVDYAIASLPRDLVVRIAPAGVAHDLAAPLLIAVGRARPSVRNFVPSHPVRTAAVADRVERAPPVPANSPVLAAARPASASVETTPANPTGAARGHLEKADLTQPLAPAVPSEAAGAAAAAGVNPGRAAPAVAPQQLARLSIAPPSRTGAHPLVVIDPGHGGHDPGTEAAGNVAEKDVALQIAERLKQALLARGVNAEMTRASDVFLSLAERTQFANRSGADLFVSIHLNSSPDTGTAGIETYYLNNTTDRATIRLARMENEVAGGYSASRSTNLNYILTDLRQNYKANEAASLAQMIEAETVADVGRATGTQVNALGAKKGPFYVLVGADMPSVLVECGFLSNPAEAGRLLQPAYQQALADGIAAAIVRYFNADAAVGNL